MYPWVLLLLSILIKFCDSTKEAHYECGPHGRFEYCIDGIPGCVTGCHCYPGYYFDTETKICEPNIKLAHDYRRHFFLEPTRLPTEIYEPVSLPTPTTVNPIDKRVDAIAKDTDDLGDWLYNQFFKTIENQVINKTDDHPLTRRSGGQPARPIPRRRSRKKSRRKSKRRKHGKIIKKKGLRRKLLRITEDDSLFDSSSDETSASSSSSSETDSDSSSSDSRDHGHRKIVMINKKSTSPLPSFIFLPNLDTPFYPPIGLPAPPILPMYPMVPVPPVLVNCSTSSATTSADTKAPPSTDAPTEHKPDQDTKAPDPLPDSNAENDPSFKRALRKNGELNKIMRLRNKMKKRNKRPPPDLFGDNFQDPETPYFNDPSSPLQFRSHPDMADAIPPVEDVDFKYLSQLIHKMDLNKPKPNIPFRPGLIPPRQLMANQIPPSHVPQIPIPPNQIPLKDIAPDLNPAMPMRRSYQTSNPAATPENVIHQTQFKPARPASKADEVNDSFYSNLGKQIATLIRKVDTKGDHEINIELEEDVANSPVQTTIFNENSYSPRSYWERFVRSPLKPKYRQDINIMKRNNDNLFNLEDQVNIAAAFERSMSLNELENIANIMQMARAKSPRKPRYELRRNNPTTEISKGFDINLLPLLRRQNDIKPHSRRITNNNYNKSKKKVEVVIERNVLVSRADNNIHPKKVLVEFKTNDNRNVTQHNVNNTKDIGRDVFLRRLLQSRIITPLHHQVSRIVHGNVTVPKTVATRQVLKYKLNPLTINYKNGIYANNNHKQYRSQHAMIPFPFFSQHALKSSIGKNYRPSYIHQEFHHFDYFE